MKKNDPKDRMIVSKLNITKVASQLNMALHEFKITSDPRIHNELLIAAQTAYLVLEALLEERE